MRHLAGPRSIPLAELMQQRGAAGIAQQLAPVADEPAGWNDELHPDAAVGIGAHLLQPALASGERALDGADVVGRDVDRDALVRLLVVAQDHLGAADRELEALAA